ncbi:PfkB family carbohydrate kinase [Geodermatophilus sp. YIM 151500]|uniref:carbohydrate kinase family protein n=1 Tax=Geodermatophilus sp. YIM 151500 TaxID=2984531 RepID=UPI0021E3F684|nr:PfkB family carbohydrate kinase [Geodermatophilus sp. YIM 151500]MCV2490845.1 PfkB family carbohydrate kinase [Geodermatophilus sp. YIM 151500]
MIVFCGYANLDVVARVPALPRPDERIHATEVVHLSGGMAANAAVAAARAGASVAFAGVLGDDPVSRRFLDELDDEGIDSAWTDRAAFLSTAVVLVDADGRRAVISQDDALGPPHVTAVAERLAGAGGGLLYLDGYRAAQVGAAARPGVTVAIDLDGCDDRDQALAAVRRAGHVVVGRRRLEELLGIPAAEWALLARASATRLLVTDGARGWALHEPDGSVVTGAALPVRVVDDTGAGDCFTGTYLAGVDAGLPPQAAAGRAGVAASLSCTVPGARGAPRPAEVDAALAPLPIPS